MYSRILIPTDGSGPSEAAVKVGLELARSLQAKVTLLYVVEPVVARILIGPETVPYYPELKRDLVAAGKQALERAEDFAQYLGVTVETELQLGSASQVILETANQHDLVVMGTHGRSGLDRFLLGSVTQKVLQRSPRPVLVVRQTGEGAS
ncbi:universal stress protein [uncultured Meiothermus sp.]|jgi:nucleotide-binding universal stress UspA family protein|uniref:universal stress protein n=1 Tax=uncultured Meiothermus sp. TaxID=157471 RepID=UPI0026092264|nr:universal stress protein [uncultured Meiothermus sp.]